MDIADLQYYRKINNISSNQSYKDLYISEISKEYNNARENTIYRFSVIVNSVDGKDVYVNGSKVPIRGVIDTSRKQSADTEMQRTLQTYPNLIKQGDYVKFKVNKTDEYHDYIITSDIDKKNGYDEGIFKKCNYTLKWIIDGKYYETPAIVTNNTKYTLGIKSQSSSGLTEADGMFGVIISYNDIAKKIQLGKRFIVNGQSWETTQLDHSSVPNVLSILLGESSKSTEYDDFENEIADRWVNNYTISLSSTSQEIQESSTYQINAIVKDKGVVVSNPSISYTSSDESIAKVDVNGLITGLKIGSCNIVATVGGISETLLLTVTEKISVPTISYSSSWSNGQLLRLMSSTTFTGTKMINSIIDDSLVIDYELDSSGQTLLSQKKITIIQKVGTTNAYTIKNTNVNTTMNFVITFKDKGNETIVDSKTITLKGV